MNAGQQFAWVEGLAQVVVGTDFQANDAVHVLTFGGQHDDGCAVAVGAQAAADRQTVLARHHQIEHDQIDRIALQHPVERLAVFGQDDFEAFLHQVAAQQVADSDVVVQHQNFVRAGIGLWHGNNSG